MSTTYEKNSSGTVTQTGVEDKNVGQDDAVRGDAGPRSETPTRRFSLKQLLASPWRETFVGPSKANWTTTAVYLAGAAICAAVTFAVVWMNKPAPIAEFGKVGKIFYPDFVDPTRAQSLEVYSFDVESVQPREFRVERSDNGQWIIPSHHDYPADAEQRLASTAASVIGIRRGALVTRWKRDHAHYGVVDPRQESLLVDDVEGVGQRLTLRGDQNALLADFIIGKPVDGSTDEFYVRHPEEDEVYITKLDIDLSTRFTDWIETDLFELLASDVRRVTINDYSFDELSGQLTENRITQLTRKNSTGDWESDAYDPLVETIDEQAIRDTLTTIANLSIVGVRPKQVGLTPELKLDRQVIKTQRGVEQLQADLLSRGFLLQPAESGGETLELIAREGELHLGSDDGLRYRLYFGRAFVGEQEEIEVGSATGLEKQKQEGPGDSDGDESKPDGMPGRYVFVRVDVEPELLGDEPQEPTKPEKPERLVELEEAAANSAEKDTSQKDTPQKDTSETNTSSQEASDEDATEADSASDSELESLRQQFAAAQSQYEQDLADYQKYRSNLQAARETAAQLNRRFAKWYYVISGSDYEKLTLDREKVFTEKSSPSNDDSEDDVNTIGDAQSESEEASSEEVSSDGASSDGAASDGAASGEDADSK